MRRLLSLLALALPLSACQVGPYGSYPPYGPQPGPYPPAQHDCPIISSQGWNAWVNAMPGPSAQPTLIVTGRVTVPTGGSRFAWRGMRVMESYPVQVVAELEIIRPAGGATQAVVTHDVRGQWPMNSPVGSLEIRCGGRSLARISPVQNAY